MPQVKAKEMKGLATVNALETCIFKVLSSNDQPLFVTRPFAVSSGAHKFLNSAIPPTLTEIISMQGPILTLWHGARELIVDPEQWKAGKGGRAPHELVQQLNPELLAVNQWREGVQSSAFKDNPEPKETPILSPETLTHTYKELNLNTLE